MLLNNYFHNNLTHIQCIQSGYPLVLSLSHRKSPGHGLQICHDVISNKSILFSIQSTVHKLDILRPVNSVISPVSSVISPVNSVISPFNSVISPVNFVISPVNSVISSVNSVISLGFSLPSSSASTLSCDVLHPNQASSFHN